MSNQHRTALIGVVLCSCVVCHGWLIDGYAQVVQPKAEQHQQEAHARRRFLLRSDPLPTPITLSSDSDAARVTTIELTGEVADADIGAAELTLGESTYTFNAFGDGTITERKPPRKYSVELHRKMVNKDDYAAEITAADLHLKNNLFVLMRSGPGSRSELLVANPGSDALSRNSIRLEPKQLVVLTNQFPHELDAQYRQRLRQKVALHSNPFRLLRAEKKQLGSIQLYGELGGKGSVTHDMNQWAYELSPKRVGGYSTMMAYFAQPAHFRRLDLPDPAKQNRQIYRVEFERPSDLGDLSVVTWPEAIGPHRLVISQAGQVNQVLTLSIGGVSLWEQRQPETNKLPASELTAVAQLSDAVPENFFNRYQIKDGHVVSIQLHDDELSHESLAILPRFPHLRELFLSGNKAVASDVVAAIQKLPSLRSLRGDYVEVSDALFKAIAELPELTSLSVYNNSETASITDEHLKLLSQSRSIKKLSLVAEKITDAGLLSMEEMSQLSALSCSAPRVTSEAAKEFSARRPNCNITINGNSFRNNK
jgi:hypothetical protein